MRLVWSDEFETPGLPDSSKWLHDTGRNREGWYNNELQYYAANRAGKRARGRRPAPHHGAAGAPEQRA